MYVSDLNVGLNVRRITERLLLCDPIDQGEKEERLFQNDKIVM